MLGYKSENELLGLNLVSLHVDPQQWFALADHFRSGERFNELVVDWL